MVTTRRSMRKSAIRERSSGMLEGGISIGDDDDKAQEKKLNKKIVFDNEDEAMNAVDPSNIELEEKIAKKIDGSDRTEGNEYDESSDDASVEEVTGASSRQLVMTQRAEEKKIVVSEKKKKRSRKRKGKQLIEETIEGDIDADVFQQIDNVRKEVKQEKEMKRTKTKIDGDNQRKTGINTHITFSSDYGMLHKQSTKRLITDHRIEVVVVDKESNFEKSSCGVNLANQPSNIAILLAQKRGTFVDSETSLWKRTKSKKLFKKIGANGF